MRTIKLLLIIIFGAAFSLQSQAKSKKEKGPEITTIYVFGVAQDLSDSIVYITDIAPVSGATLMPHDILQNHQYYSEQLTNYLKNQLNETHLSVAFFYSRDRKKIEKKAIKVTEKMKKRAYRTLTFTPIDYNTFHFKVPVLVSGE